MDLNNNDFNIDLASSFEEIARIKENAYLVNKTSGINIEKILSELYKNRTHFIFELLQNAEDAKASEVEFILTKNELVFQHNGRPFTIRDIKGITGVNYSDKPNSDITQIGKFGIGFKAVFAICDSPEIYSDEYNFRIRNFYVPEKINHCYSNQQRHMTYIVLPFKENDKEVYGLIEKALTELNPDTMVFLKNIQSLKYRTDTRIGYYKRSKKRFIINENEYYLCQVTSGQGNNSGYVVFLDRLENGLDISIAYNYDFSTNSLITKEDSTKLIVFFKTERDTFLKFKIHGPYQTTPTRESVPETEANISILNKTIQLYKKSIITLRDLKLINASFLESLPIEKKYYDDLFYDAFYNATIELFQNEDILPTATNEYKSSSDCLLSRGSVMDLLTKEDMESLFNRHYWLSNDITRDKTRKLVEFLLTVLKIREIDYDIILSNITIDFFKNKKDDWYIRFYSRGNNLITTFKKYLTKPFVITENGDIVSPYKYDDKGQLNKNVFFQSSTKIDNSSMIIKNELLKNEDVHSFFKAIGITEIDIVEYVRTIYLKEIINSKNEQEYYNNIYFLYLLYKEQSFKQSELRRILSNSSCLAFNDDYKGLVFTKPNELFMAHGDAKILYSNCEQIHFITKQIDELAQEDEEFFRFLTDIGVNVSIRFDEVDSGLSDKEKNELLNGSPYSSIQEHSFDIFHIDDILKDMNLEKSKLLWNCLNNTKEEFFTSELNWRYYRNSHKKQYKSNFIRVLQKTKWLFNVNNDCVKPSEIYIEDVLKTYEDGLCIKAFDFKPDATKNLPEEDQRRLDITKNIPLDVLEELSKQYDIKEDPQVIEVIPENKLITIDEANPINNYNSLSSNELIENTNDKNEENDSSLFDDLYSDTNIPDTIIEQIMIKRVSNESQIDGDLGERYVLSALRKKYLDTGFSIYNDNKYGFTAEKDDTSYDVVRNNKDGKNQRGFDISIIKDGDIIEYIEVKSKKGNSDEYFKVSGLQWEFAKKLYEEGKGNIHSVYIVTNVRDPEKTRITKYNNPYKKWINGELEADPVRIKC